MRFSLPAGVFLAATSLSSGFAADRIIEAAAIGTSMLPLVKPGEALLILESYYKNHPVQRGDYIAYNHPGYKNPLGKIVVGLPGDHWSVNKKGACSEIVVNGKALANSAGKLYAVSGKPERMLGSYARAYPVIPENAYLILGDDTDAGVDSRKMGLVSGSSFLGKIVRTRTAKPL